MNIKNMILAIPAAAPAIPPNPNTAAINAITTNVIVQRNISFKFLWLIFKMINRYFYFLLLKITSFIL